MSIARYECKELLYYLGFQVPRAPETLRVSEALRASGAPGALGALRAPGALPPWRIPDKKKVEVKTCLNGFKRV